MATSPGDRLEQRELTMGLASQGILAALLALTGCDAMEGSRDHIENIGFKPGMTVREMVSDDLYRELKDRLGAEDEPGVVTIGSPHKLRLQVGGETIELEPGGYNSMTSLMRGYRPDTAKLEDADYGRIGEVSTDTGSRRLTRRAARELAVRLCATAERGLGAKSRHDPAKVIDGPTPEQDRMPAIGARASDVCVVEGAGLTFIMRFSGPDQVGDGSADMEDTERFRLQVSLGQTFD